MEAEEISSSNALIDVYSKCGSMIDAKRVFDSMIDRDVVSWTSIMHGYVQAGDGDAALDLFRSMIDQHCQPNALTFVAAIKSCSIIAAKDIDRALATGIDLHNQASKLGFCSQLVVANTLIDMYINCRSLPRALEVFRKIDRPDVVSWNTLLLGYVDNGEIEQGLGFFDLMKVTKNNVDPDARTFAAVLKACAGLPSLETGREVHREIIRRGLEINNRILQSGLVDFYGKCGSMVEAEQFFVSIRRADAVTWTALIAGYSRQGNSGKVFEFFSKMIDEKVPANGAVLLCVLSACSHAGLVDSGRRIFAEMRSRFGVRPRIEHYHGLIDLLGRANRLDEALELIRSMPWRPSSVTWKTILAACEKWNNVAIARVAFEAALENGDDGKGCGSFVLMSNVCRSS